MEMTRRKIMTGPRFLSFVLNDEAYCIEILKVKELLGMSGITPIPQTPEYIRGVLNLRGQIIPVIDLRLKFGLPFKEYNKRTSIIVTELNVDGDATFMGVVVDTIHEVLSIPQEKIVKIPYINAKIKAEYIKGVAETTDGIKIVLDIEKVLNEDDFVLLKEIENKAV